MVALSADITCLATRFVGITRKDLSADPNPQLYLLPQSLISNSNLISAIYLFFWAANSDFFQSIDLIQPNLSSSSSIATPRWQSFENRSHLTMIPYHFCPQTYKHFSWVHLAPKSVLSFTSIGLLYQTTATLPLLLSFAWSSADSWLSKCK